VAGVTESESTVIVKVFGVEPDLSSLFYYVNMDTGQVYIWDGLDEQLHHPDDGDGVGLQPWKILLKMYV
jgi:hypothetical protein